MRPKGVVLALFVLFTMSQPAWGDAAAVTDEGYARSLFGRLAGVPILRTDPRLPQMTALIATGDYRGAAQIATADENFYAVTLRNWAGPMSAHDESPMTVFNDFQATLIGAVRDRLDARTLLTGDYLYEGYDDIGLPRVEPDNNAHYEAIEQRRIGLKRNLRQRSPQWQEVPPAGVLTSRTWGHQHLVAGTNRRGVEFAMQVFLCAPISQWRDRGVYDYHVRRDVDRAPGGNPQTYQDECRSCHALMDSLGGAYAHYDFVDGQLIHTPVLVAAKMNQNSHLYPQGFVTYDDSWVNYATRNHNVALGWRGPTRGHGLQEFGTMLANSSAFSQCMVKRAFQTVCRRELGEGDEAYLSSMEQDFEGGGYDLRRLFENVAASGECLRHPGT